MAKITCIANNGTDGSPEVPLWECPCATCTKIEWETLDEDEGITLRAHRHGSFPESWDAQGRSLGDAS